MGREGGEREGGRDLEVYIYLDVAMVWIIVSASPSVCLSICTEYGQGDRVAAVAPAKGTKRVDPPCEL